MNTPQWDPAGHPIHRLIQYLDTLTVAVARFQQITFFPPFFQGSSDEADYDPQKRLGALMALRTEHRTVLDRLFPREGGSARDTAASLADAAVAYFVRHGRTDAERWVREAAVWIGDAGTWVPRTAEPSGGEWPKQNERFERQQEALFRMGTVRANLFAELARCGQPTPSHIYGRVDNAPVPPLPPGKTTISVDELLRWADAARQSSTPPVGNDWGEGGPPTWAVQPGSRSVTLIANAERARQSKERDGELRREREQLWAEFLGVFSPLRIRWFGAWRPVAEAVNGGDVEATATALAEVAGAFATIDRAVACWTDNARSWLRTAKENNSAWECLSPVDRRPAYVSDTACWADKIAGAGGLRAFVLKTPVVYLDEEYSRPQAVLTMLAEGATAGQFARLFLAWGGVDCLRGVTSAMAVALVLPDAGHQFDPFELPADDQKRTHSATLLRHLLLPLDSPDLLEVMSRSLSHCSPAEDPDPTVAVGVSSHPGTRSPNTPDTLPLSARKWLQLKFLADPLPTKFPTPAGYKRTAFVRFDEFAEFLLKEKLDPLPNLDRMHKAGWILDIRIDLQPSTSDDAPELCPELQRVAIRLALGPGEHRVIGIPETICELSPDSPLAATDALDREDDTGEPPQPNSVSTVREHDETTKEPPLSPYAELRKWAGKELKGKQRAAIEAVCDSHGQMPIADLGASRGVDWSDAKKGFDNLKYQLSKELKSLGWKLYRHDNEARLELIPHSERTHQ